MTQNIQLSIVIVTKNRLDELKKCLKALFSQTELPAEVIIINNNSSDGTEKFVASLHAPKGVVLRMIKEQKNGYPAIYNRGLKEARFDWVGFIDDDCIAKKNWVAVMKRALSKNPNVTAFLGYSETQVSSNLFCLTTSFFQNYWKERACKKRKIKDLEILDNKNIVYNNLFLKKFKIRYDERRAEDFNGASEDCDLGMQIFQKNGTAIYVREAIVEHLDPMTFTHFWKKTFLSINSYSMYVKKWQLTRLKIKRGNLTIMSFFLIFCQQHQLNFFKKVQLFLLILNVGLVTKIMRIFNGTDQRYSL